MTQLQPISIHDLPELQALYRREGPKYFKEYYVLSTVIKYIKTEPGLKHFNAYTLADSHAQELGLFLLVDRYQLFVGCLGNKFDLLEHALHQLDWSRGFQCSSFAARYLATILKVIEAKQLTITSELHSNLYTLPAEEAMQLRVDCPEGFQLRPLVEADAQLIDKMWSYSGPGSLYFIQRQIRLCPSMGLYDMQSNKLVAWCVRTMEGLLAAMQVDNAYRRRGFGTIVVAALSREIGALGDDVGAEVHPENIISSSIFNKLGFRVSDQCYLRDTAPENGKFTWPNGQ
ncbi:uncharacterized protein LOC133844463 [Drosophila sulfurigaster albostrigata]|uniref:uncharacterized protein LOC133844463 n=1 Tax=Drosophila sulfurigaster albostrigata TaxID=89887 RepID=UPI002D21E272|nr:uncharacterized protein LOC133844463 [Drosophila sulfurigaster albostrigata]